MLLPPWSFPADTACASKFFDRFLHFHFDHSMRNAVKTGMAFSNWPVAV